MTRFLTPVALDFVWESLSAGELPYPLTAQSHGETMDQRSRLRHQVFEDLRTQDMVDGRGRVSPDIADRLTLLTHGTHSVDAIFENSSALAAGDGHRALLAVQTAEGLTLQQIDPGAVVSSVVALLPPCARGREQSITIPSEDLDRMAAGRSAGRTATDRQVLKALSTQPKLRAGQLAANTRTHVGTRKRSPVLSWFDTEDGRYLTYTKQGQDGTPWVTIAPADAPTLRHHLTELLAKITPR